MSGEERGREGGRRGRKEEGKEGGGKEGGRDRDLQADKKTQVSCPYLGGVIPGDIRAGYCCPIEGHRAWLAGQAVQGEEVESSVIQTTVA